MNASQSWKFPARPVITVPTPGLPGHGHQMMSEKNSAGISKLFMTWLDKNVH